MRTGRKIKGSRRKSSIVSLRTFVPFGLPQDLVAGGHVFFQGLGVPGLANLCKVVLCVSAVLVEGGSLETFLNGSEVD